MFLSFQMNVCGVAGKITEIYVKLDQAYCVNI